MNPTAAVWFEYKPHAGKAPVTEQQIADLVSSSVEGLKPEKVKVIGTQATPSDVADVENRWHGEQRPDAEFSASPC